jgi:HEPN domain-containing protein/predicted nucleotidyltransferase
MRAADMLDPVLSDIVAAARERLAPSRIILFGSRARGDARPDSDYDVLVETELQPTIAEAWTSVDAVRDARHVSIDVHVRAPGELERRRSDPGWIDGEIMRDGVLLYGTGSTVERVEQLHHVCEPPSGEWPSVRAWLHRADRDMQLVDREMARSDPLWEIIAFHAQQAAEKTMKAGLVMRGRRPPRTHLLSQLFAELLATGAPLPDLATDWKGLEPYAVEGRYPNAVAIPTDADGRALVESARRIMTAVLALRV